MLTRDVTEIQQLIALYGHVADGELDRLDDVFTEDGVFDAGATSGGVHLGVEAIRAFFQREAPPHPPSHHATNVYAYEDGGTVRVLSKWFAVDKQTGGLRSGDYRDVVVRTGAGWRIAERVVVRRWWGGPVS
jgi:ketosteroid isomerase-like protein